MIATLDKHEVVRFAIERVHGDTLASSVDDLSVEEPLEIRLNGKPLAVTMRTPGNDVELAAGFLFTEGIISDPSDLVEIEIDGRNIVRVRLKRDDASLAAASARHSFITSSCGVCGKRSIAAVQVSRRYPIAPLKPQLALDVIHSLPGAARGGQTSFAQTGGIHASALFDTTGRLLSLREDVGRHNALDKLLGDEFLAGRIPMTDRIVFLSGRVSFELVQKAAIAGTPVLAAVGAPSSLAVELARECGMTLLGFVREERFNVYNDLGRMVAD